MVVQVIADAIYLICVPFFCLLFDVHQQFKRRRIASFSVSHCLSQNEGSYICSLKTVHTKNYIDIISNTSVLYIRSECLSIEI